jgi:hypothetical protein
MSSSTREVDALFKLPLGEFTSARNALAAELKKAGRKAEADETKALTKPSVSAWVVNQLYWRHRGLFDKLIDAGDRMRRAQAAQGDAAREAASARREAVTALSKIAEGLLLGGDYGATRDMLRRVTTTLDALSSYGSLPNAPSAGRLTDDVEPPGFEALLGMPSGGKTRPAPRPAAPKQASSVAAAKKAARAEQRAAQRAEEERKKVLAANKAAVQDAERALKAAKKQAERAAAQFESAATRAKALEAELKEATAAVANAELGLEAARRRSQ